MRVAISFRFYERVAIDEIVREHEGLVVEDVSESGCTLVTGETAINEFGPVGSVLNELLKRSEEARSARAEAP